MNSIECASQRLRLIRDKMAHGEVLSAEDLHWAGEMLAQQAIRVREIFLQAPHYGEGSEQKTFGRIELLSYILPPKVRREVFEPAFEDFRGDFLRALGRFTSKGERKWLTFCFGFHTSRLVCQSAWAALSDKVKRLILKFLPEILRRWRGGIS